MIDDISILAMSSVYLIYTFKRKKFNALHFFLTVIIWFGGFGCKGYGLTLIDPNKTNVPLLVLFILFLMVVIRTFTMPFYLPIICGD